MDVLITKGEVKGVEVRMPSYCKSCKPDAHLQIRYVVSDPKILGMRNSSERDREVEDTRLFSVDEGWFQDIDVDGEGQYLISIEQYPHGVCNGCAENTTEQEECTKCRRSSKK